MGGSSLKALIKDALNHSRVEKGRTYVREPGRARIVVVGTGGAGNNTVNRLMTIGIQGAECIAVNTDKQHLDSVKAHRKILIGENLTKGLGAGGFPEIGAAAAEESRDILTEVLYDTDLVFITYGLGGGTGTGSGPIIAEIAKENGAIVVGVVTMPFKVERARIKKAKEGLRKLIKKADTVVVIDNNRLLEIAPDLPIDEAFSVADEILANMVKGITETIALPSLINLDYADVRAIMSNGEVAIVGLGESSGHDRAREAVMDALQSPLLDIDITGAKGALIHVSGGPDMSLREAARCAEIVVEKMDPNAQVIWGARVDPHLEDLLRVILIVTGVKSPHLLGPNDGDNLELFEEEFGELEEDSYPGISRKTEIKSFDDVRALLDGKKLSFTVKNGKLDLKKLVEPLD